MHGACIGQRDSETVAVEYDEFADARPSASLARAEEAVDLLVDRRRFDQSLGDSVASAAAMPS